MNNAEWSHRYFKYIYGERLRGIRFIVYKLISACVEKDVLISDRNVVMSTAFYVTIKNIFLWIFGRIVFSSVEAVNPIRWLAKLWNGPLSSLPF